MDDLREHNFRISLRSEQLMSLIEGTTLSFSKIKPITPGSGELFQWKVHLYPCTRGIMLTASYLQRLIAMNDSERHGHLVSLFDQALAKERIRNA